GRRGGGGAGGGTGRGGHAIVFGQGAVHERVVPVQHIQNRAVTLDHVGNEPDGLLEHRFSKLVRENGEAFAVHRVVILKPTEVQPGAREFRGHPARAVVFQHPANLRRKHGRLPKVIGGGVGEQFFIGHAGPEEVTQPAGKRVTGQRAVGRSRRSGDSFSGDSRIGVHQVHAIEEIRRDQKAGD